MQQQSHGLKLAIISIFFFSPRSIDGLTCGAVGSIGTLLAYRRKEDDMEEKLNCVYCKGTGQIRCGKCLGLDSRGVEDCDACESIGTVRCINCGGSGRSIPDVLLQTLGDQEAGLLREDLSSPILDRALQNAESHQKLTMRD
jgi:hypothetical protein